MNARTTRRLLLGAALGGVALLAPGVAAAQFAERLAVRGELGAGSMLAARQQDALGYGLTAQGTVRVGLGVVDALAVQVSAGYWFFPSDAGFGAVTPVTGGLRFEPRVGRAGRLFVDGNAGVALSGGDPRFTFDAGAGFEFAVARSLHVGPVIRYAQVLPDTSIEEASAAQYWSVGVSLAFRPPHEGPAPVTLEAPHAPPPPEAPPTPPPPEAPAPPPDRDGDGVLDDADLCAAMAPGPFPDPERPGCPDGDDDNDGVRNHLDVCLIQAQGPVPNPERPGCPSLDRDHDFVPDAVDACPERPGAPSSDRVRNGCPGLVLVADGQLRISRPVFFATRSDRILARSFPVLQAVADALQFGAGIRRVSVDGHSDNAGAPAANLALSERRAASVMAWLGGHGVESTRLEAHGYGPTRPVAPNITRRGRASNRRVEFRIVDPAPAGR